MHPSSTSCGSLVTGPVRRSNYVSVRLADDLSGSHARNEIAEPKRLKLGPRCQVAGEKGRRQPAQRPTIAQDCAFLNYRARAHRRSLVAGHRLGSPVRTRCPTDWPLRSRQSRV